jgi:hypothetical protein
MCNSRAFGGRGPVVGAQHVPVAPSNLPCTAVDDEPVQPAAVLRGIRRGGVWVRHDQRKEAAQARWRVGVICGGREDFCRHVCSHGWNRTRGQVRMCCGIAAVKQLVWRGARRTTGHQGTKITHPVQRHCSWGAQATLASQPLEFVGGRGYARGARAHSQLRPGSPGPLHMHLWLHSGLRGLELQPVVNDVALVSDAQSECAAGRRRCAVAGVRQSLPQRALISCL